MAGHRIYNTPLFQKIGIKQGMKFAAIDAPTWITEELKKQLLLPDVNILSGPDYNLIWIFDNTINGMESKLKNAKNRIVKNGIIWVSWYKKASKKHTELNEDLIRDTALALDLVDVKVASVDDDWSALKLVIPVTKR
jgi:hypothetical protein